MDTYMTSFLLSEQERSVNLRDSSVRVTVPDYPITILMYYIKCINSLIDLEISSKLTKYANHEQLTTNEETEILIYACLLHPDIFVKKGIIFESDKYCSDSNNNFLKSLQSKNTK